MTSSKVSQALDIALKKLGLNKVCFAKEDEGGYYFTGCCDDGARIRGNACCRVDKITMECEMCFHTDKRLNTPKTDIVFPKDREDVFIPFEETY